MGSKDKKSKDGKKKKKSHNNDDDEDPLTEEQEEEEDSKKKKKKKAKKESVDSDEDKKKKGKKSKNKQVDYAAIYQNELLNYHTDSSDGYEDEYFKKKVYEVVTVTGDVKGAGTDANVFVTLFGDFGITPKVHLASKSRTAFEKNKTDIFRIKTHNVGPIKKLRIEHDNTGMNASWFLDRVVVTDVNRPHLRFYFACNNWLSREEGDNLFVRDLLGSLNPMDVPKLNKYIVSVFTADMKGSGTDADVFLNIFGENGDTGERRLDSDKDNFERGSEDKFTIEAPNLGRLRKITIGHNNRGSSAGWFLDKVVIDDMGNKEVYEFPVNRWFAMDEDDGKIQRDVLVGIIYNVQVMTGNVRGAGTNSKIHMVMHGSKGLKNSGKIFLEGGAFERGLIDIFNVEICELISPLSRVTIGHDNGAIGAGWYCEKVVIYCPFTGIEQTFPCGMWLDEDEGDGLIERELYEMVSLRQKKQKKYPWSLWIWTSDVKGAGTDAQVFLQIYGEKGKSDEIKLENNSDNFEQGQLDRFMIEMPDIGRLMKLRIWHEKRNPFAGWHLAKITLLKTLTMEKYSFQCGRWLDISEDDNEIVRELPATGALIDEYRVTICTGTVSGSGTDARVFLNIIGDLGDTGERLMVTSKNNVNKFEKGNHDEFLIESVSLGQVRRVRVGHDGRGGGCGWFLDKVMVREEGQPESMAIEFPCFRWLDHNEDDGQIVRELVPAGDGLRLFNVSYHIAIKTGNVSGASSNSKVFVKLYGEKGDTDKMILAVSDNDLKNYFETGRTDIFTIETYDIGQINRLLIGHTNEGLRAGWFLDSVQISVPVHGTQYMFPSHRWLCKDEADGKVEVEIYPSEILDIEQLIIYEVTVVTGDVRAGGTNANVFCQIYGDKGKTEVLALKSRSNNFERGTTEIFKTEAQDVGKIYKIRIYHDGKGIGDGWFLETVDIKRLMMEVVVTYSFPCNRWYFFPCKRWLAVDEDDGQLARELVPVDEAFMKKGDDDEEDAEATLGLEQKAMSTTYTIRIKTGEKKYAGTDANVFITLYGTKDDTGIINLKASKTHKNKFERGMIDEFTVEAVDIGPLKKLQIGHDNCGSAGWFLDWVEIDAPSLGKKQRFPCGQWLDKGEDDGAIIRDLFPNPLQTEYYTPSGYDTFSFSFIFLCVSTRGRGGCILREELRTCLFVLLSVVEIRRLLRKGKGSETAIFPCERWLAKSEDDRETVRELVPSDIITEKLSRDGSLKVTEVEVEDALEISVMTGDVYGAGTNANVFLTIYGNLGDTGERKLNKSETNTNKFERGSVDKFTIEAVDLGQVFKIKIRHDNSMVSPDWYLDQVEVVDVDTEEVFLFLCERWLSKKREDRLLCPSCTVIPYHITICTGLEREASTTSRAYVIIIGTNHTQTERLWLDLSDGRKGFETGTMESFESYGSDVGDVKKVELGHDGATPESCWLVDELSVAVPTKGVKYIFACKCWLAKDRGDGLTTRVFNVLDAEAVSVSQKIIYEVTVITGDVQNAGTDTQIFMTVFGANGSTEEMLLQKNEDRFERGHEDTFKMEINDIAPLRKMRLRIDGSGSRPDWFLDKVKEVSEFTYEDWLSRTRGPKRTMICEMAAVVDGEMMVELTTYIVQVKTSDVSRAGTDANVWVIIFGENGDSGTLALKESSKPNKFERKQLDTFRFLDILSLGELSKVRVWHDNTGIAPGWHLEYIDVKDEMMDKMFRFPCDRWLAKSDDDGQIMRDLACANNDYVDLNEKTKYEICITTGDTAEAETKENAWIILEGKKGRSKEFVMENSSKKRRFLRGNVDRFEFSSKNLGDIAGICLGHTPKDGKKVKGEVYWLVEDVVITERELGNKYIFTCNALIPLSPKRDDFLTFECTKTIESFASKARSLVPIKYEIIVVTGDEKGAGTDANVFIVIYGSSGDSGRRKLRQKFRNLFERGQTDRFLLEMLDMGELQKVLVEHDNSGINPSWLLDRVEVTNTASGVTTIFLCRKWLDIKKADRQIARALYPKY
uniref:PLAT domain-containing protein n=1 Tax=Monopterus albus TaxID=43700 RepID=A0A3Q3IQT0_MONAL